MRSLPAQREQKLVEQISCHAAPVHGRGAKIVNRLNFGKQRLPRRLHRLSRDGLSEQRRFGLQEPRRFRRQTRRAQANLSYFALFEQRRRASATFAMAMARRVPTLRRYCLWRAKRRGR